MAAMSTPDRIVYLENMRAELESALLRGATEISYGDQRVKYDSEAAMRSRLRSIDDELSALTSPAGQARRRLRRIVVQTSKGF